jgi:hypothetical protein
VQVDIQEGQRLSYSGKGAGAGVMLAGTMGPMGIAIGAAIDVGIAKKIEEQALQANFDLRNVIEEAFESAATPGDLNVTVLRYGFENAQAHDDIVDPVTPFLELEIAYDCRGGCENVHSLRVPNGVSDLEECSVPTFPLEALKINGSMTVEAFQRASACAAALHAASR